MYPATQIQTAS